MAYIDRFNPPNMHHIGGINYVMMTDCANMVKEIERLREAAKDRPNDAADEIERLREALAIIANIINPYEDADTMQEIARAALKEGE